MVFLGEKTVIDNPFQSLAGDYRAALRGDGARPIGEILAVLLDRYELCEPEAEPGPAAPRGLALPLPAAPAMAFEIASS